MKQAAHYSPLAFLFSLALLGGTPAFGGAFEPSARWDPNEVRVCWLDSAEFKKNPNLLDESLYFNEDNLFHSPELSDVIESRIKAEFTPAKTGIHFTGFGKCRIPAQGGLPDADAVLALETFDSFHEIIEGGASIGMSVIDLFRGEILRRDPKEDPGLPSLVIQIPSEKIYSSKSIGYHEAISLTALHEFGHLAGLHHEHSAYRDEALRDPYCGSSPFADELKKGPDQVFSLVPKKYTENLYELKSAIRSGYDSKSIMNYCHTRHLFASGGKIELSAGDRSLLKSVYPE